MGFGFLVLLISFVPLSRARDLRQPPPVDRRSAPDPLLGEIFNDPTATSLTKLNLEDGDNDNDDNISGSGSDLWSGSGELPKPSGDSSKTVATDSHQGLQTATTQTTTSTTQSSDSDNNQSIVNSESAGTTAQDTNSLNTPPAAQNVSQESSTTMPWASSAVMPHGADSKLPATEDQSQNKVVQSEESATTATNETAVPNANLLASKSQTLVENIAEEPNAGFFGQQPSVESPVNAAGFDDNTLYDPTIVKKTDIPDGLDMDVSSLVNNTMDLPGAARSSIPEAPSVSFQAPAVPKSAVAAVPYKGSFPLQLHKYSPYAKLMKKNMVSGVNAGLNQQPVKKNEIPQRSVIPSLTASGGLLPLSVNLPQNVQQQDLSRPQAPASNQSPNPNPFADQPQVTPPVAPAPQPYAAAPTATQPPNQSPTASQPLSQAPPAAPLQNPQQQALDQAQGDVPQAPEQAFSPQVPAPADMQAPGLENTVAAFPMNATMSNPISPLFPETVGIPPQGAQVVPVYKGLTPKKPVIEEDQCEDQFATCPEMAKSDYCTKYPDLMKIQCKKSCHFCEIHAAENASAGSSSGYDEYSDSGSSSYYDAEETSSSGSSDWNDAAYEADEPEYKKSTIPRPIHQVLMAKFAGEAGLASDASGSAESSASADDSSQTSGSGEAASGAQKKDDINMAASGSGEAASSVSSSASATDFGSGSASLAEDLATGTVSKGTEKHSAIPQAPRPQQESVYPKIDLKEIAKAVNLYRGVALKMLGEALEGAAQEKENELSKKSQIPLPPATDILQKMGFPVGYDLGAKRNMIPNGMAPNYGMMGYGANGYAYNYPNTIPNEPLADFYNQYQQQPNMARSEIMASPEDDEQLGDDEGAAQDEQPEEILPVAPPSDVEKEHVKEENKTVEVTKVQDEPEASENKTSENTKKSEITDPFEYVRTMGQGASMEPIRSLTAARETSMTHSNPIVLWKSSQAAALSVLAKKKSNIPEPVSEPAMPAFTSQTQTMQESFQAPEQQFRSDIPSAGTMMPLVQQNITSDMPDVSAQFAPVFPQSTPQAESLMPNTGDDLAARSQIETLAQSTQPLIGGGEQESSLSTAQRNEDE